MDTLKKEQQEAQERLTQLYEEREEVRVEEGGERMEG